ncbi:MAG: hypothetical protein J6T65_11340 [Clostridia bacterium]|nr:hypothetical protein [Clostridia bacterium]
MAEKIEVAQAYVSIIPSMAGSQSEITKELTGVTTSASESAGTEGGKKFGDTFASALKTTGAVIGAALTAATGAAIATGKAFIDAANDVSAMGDAIGDNAAKMMLDTQSYQEWDFVLQRAGSSIDSMKTAMKTLANAAVSGSDAFTALGISQEQLASMNQAELFEATVKALQNVTDEQERMALASSLLGKGAVELGGIFAMTNEELDESKQKMYELGAYMDEGAIAASDNYQDTLIDVQDSLKGLKISMMKDFLPGITSVMTGLSKVFSGNGGIEEIKEGLEGVTSKITELSPQFFAIAEAIVTALLAGFGPMLPQVVTSIFSFINQALLTVTGMTPQLLPAITAGIQGIMSSLFECLPIIIQSLLQLTTDLVTWLSSPENIDAFVNGLIQLVTMVINQISLVLPIILPAIIRIVGEIINCLLEPSNVEMLIGAVLQLAGAVFMALVNAVPELIDFIVGLFGNIGALLIGFIDKGSDIVATGIGYVVNFLKGIGEKVNTGASTVWNAIKNTFSNGINAVKNFVTNGLNSVKDKFHSIFETVKNTVKSGIDKVKSFFNFQWSLPKLKMPHFNISGKFSLDPPSVPSFGIDWYAKAMNEPMMLNGATIFGEKDGKLLGGGEVGSEIIIGTDKLLNMMRDAVGTDGRAITINVYGAEGQDVNDLADRIAYKLEEMTQRRSAVYG